MQNIAAAFSEEQTARLTGVSRSQLRYWDRTDFYRPAFTSESRRIQFSRVYSFQDIVALRVLNALRNDLGVSLPHLRDASARLRSSVNAPWTGVKLWVVNKRVVWQEPDTDAPQEIISKQYVPAALVLEDVASRTREDVAQFRKQRDPATVGFVERHRYVNHNAPVLAGTRIPVQAIKRFADAGYTEQEILLEYPDLEAADIKAAIAYESKRSAA